MAATHTGKVSISIEALQIINDGIKAGVIPHRIVADLDLQNGTSDGQIDRSFAVTETAKAASGTTSYDLTSLTDVGGGAVAFAEVVLLVLRNKRTTAVANLTVGPAAANGFGRLAAGKGFWPADLAADADQGNVVGPDSWLVLYDKTGVPVANGSTDALQVVTSAVVGDTNSWDLVILGRSA